jgi:hypothetical protein
MSFPTREEKGKKTKSLCPHTFFLPFFGVDGPVSGEGKKENQTGGWNGTKTKEVDIITHAEEKKTALGRPTSKQPMTKIPAAKG